MEEESMEHQKEKKKTNKKWINEKPQVRKKENEKSPQLNENEKITGRTPLI
jgi:hypothetical protein